MKRTSPFKLSLISLLVATPAVSMAYADLTPCTFSGWTIGLGLGASTFMADTRSSTDIVSDPGDFEIIPDNALAAVQPSFTFPGNSASIATKAHLYQYGVMGNLFVGYGSVLDNHAYWGAELGLNAFGARETSLKNSANNTAAIQVHDIFIGPPFAFEGVTTYQNSLASNTQVSRSAIEPYLDLKLGFLMTPTSLVYVKGGINYNTLKVKTNANHQVVANMVWGEIDGPIPPFSVTDSGVASSAIESSKSKSEIGYRAGIGGEVLITPEFGVAAEYIYSFYPKTKKAVNGIASDVSCDALEGCQVVDASISNNSKTTFSDQQVMAKLIYHFG